MDRRISPRAALDAPLVAFVDGRRHTCRAIDLSINGLVIERPSTLGDRTLPTDSPLELQLGGERPVRVRAKSVWRSGRYEAVRFVLIQDADRLTIAEQLDRTLRFQQPLH